MKKTLIFNFLLLTAWTAHAQEEASAEVVTFWFLKDMKFLMLFGGAVFLIILLIVKKVLAKRASNEEYEEGDETTENYEDSNL